MSVLSRFQAAKRILCMAAVVLVLALVPDVHISAEPVDNTIERFYEKIAVDEFYVDGLSAKAKDKVIRSEWWYSQWEDCRYLFLPASANRKKLTIHYKGTGTLKIGGTAVTDGMTTDLFSKADEFQVTLGTEECGTLKIMQSDRAAVFLTAGEHGIAYLNKHEDDEEHGPACILDTDGTALYRADNAELSGHGNSTWKNAPKKSYNLKLPQKADLFGMGKAKKWMLIANYYDNSMLRNAVGIQMSVAAGMEYAVDYVFTDLWVDGQYLGTYQFCERIEIQKNRINIRDLEEETEEINEKDLKEYTHRSVGAGMDDYMENTYRYYRIPNNPEDITGGYLVQFQLYNRYPEKAKSGFVTSRGQAVQIDGPKYATHKQVEYIRDFMQDLEDAIYSEDGYNSKGKHYSDYIDTESLALAYLVQEISMNIDGPTTSFYLWKDSDSNGDGKLHCGPVWDFDYAFYNYRVNIENGEGDKGTGGNYKTLLVPCFPIHGYDTDLTDDKGSNRPTAGLGWLGQLYKYHPEFAKQVALLYYERFDAYLLELCNAKAEGGCLIKQWADDLKASADMNNARWHMLGVNKPYMQVRPNTGETYEACVEHVRRRVELRRNYLRGCWLDVCKEELGREIESLAPDYDLYDITDAAALVKEITNQTARLNSAKTYDNAVKAVTAVRNALKSVPKTEITGDFDDDTAVTLRDAQALLLHYARELAGFEDTVNATQKRNGDTDHNGILNASDTVHILRFINARALGDVYEFPT